MTVDQRPASVADTLRAAKALIDAPEKWTKGEYARKTVRGHGLNVKDPEATRFCMLGALHRVDGPHEVAASWTLREVVGVIIPLFNDARGRTHADVMAAFDKAIALAEQQEARS